MEIWTAKILSGPATSTVAPALLPETEAVIEAVPSAMAVTRALLSEIFAVATTAELLVVQLKTTLRILLLASLAVAVK